MSEEVQLLLVIALMAAGIIVLFIKRKDDRKEFLDFVKRYEEEKNK